MATARYGGTGSRLTIFRRAYGSSFWGIGDVVSRGNGKNSSLAAAILVPCASRKFVQPSEKACAVSLPNGMQRDLEIAWLSRAARLTAVCSAGALYGGRGFRLAQQAAQNTGAQLYIASAGLGLIAAGRRIPSYGITVGGQKGPDSVDTRVIEPFDPIAWWRAVNTGPFATPLDHIFSEAPHGPVIVALTRPYAHMLAPALDELPEEAITRLRIIGVRLEDFLPPQLRPFMLPYDERLNALLPGTRADFPQRALLHFASEGLPVLPKADAQSHRDWVQEALAHQKAPQQVKRPRLSDQAIMAVIERHLNSGSTRGIGRLLLALRREEGIACEQARFTRLYRASLARREAA